jgi:eukaryotic-like serine/threonine-protein kinase
MIGTTGPRDNDAQWERVQALFHASLAQPVDARDTFLAREAAGDEALLKAVRMLLEGDAAGLTLLERGVGGWAQDLLDDDASVRERTFGPYRILQRLGAGGMGVVLLARRDDLGSLAAIKVLRDAWLSPERRDRFAAEQRTLAHLSHPSIARLYDAGVLADGTPFLVMEYVEGVPLTEYCAAHGSALIERLRLFRAVCDAVRYAHGQLVIHRDLKPSNILVTADGSVKLLDFGIAKQLDSIDEDLTRTGMRLMTPAYASPEQVRGERAGTDTDIYALGVVLYQLLSGRLPHDLSGTTPGEAERRILEQTPERPSAAMRVPGTDATASRWPISSVSRGQWPDLDVLCLTAMHKDRSRRYSTVDALIRDIDHFLRHEPLEARPDSARYRLRKFTQRHVRALTATAAVIVVLIGLVTYYTVRLTRARNAALVEATRTQRIQRFMLNLFNGGDDAAGPADELKVVTLVDRGVQEARGLDAEPVVQADLYQTLGSIYQKLGKLDRADALLRSALDRRRTMFDPDGLEVAGSEIALGQLRQAQAAFDEAERLVRDGLAKTRARTEPTDPAVGKAMLALGEVLVERGSYDRAIPILQDAMQLNSLPRAEAAVLADTLSALANAQFYIGHLDESEALNRQLLADYRKLYGDRHPYVADTIINLGAIEFERGRFAESERIHRQALEMYRQWYGTDHPETASAATMVGRALAPQNRLDEALTMMREALAIQERVYGRAHPRVASALNEVGLIAMKQGRLDEAEASFSRMTQVYRDVYHDKHRNIGIALSNLAGVYQEKKQYGRAESIFRDVLRRYAEVLPADHQLVGIAKVRLGRQLLYQRRFVESERETRAGYELLVKQSTPPDRWLNVAREDLAAAYDGLENPEEATRFREELVKAHASLTGNR